MIPIYIAFEDALSEAVLRRIVSEANLSLQIVVSIGGRGNTYLKTKFPALRKTANSIPVLLLTDLDNSTCAPELIKSWRGETAMPKSLLFRIAVRETESWLLADRKGFSNYSGIPKIRIPNEPESLIDPKQTLLNLVRRYGRRDVKGDLLPTLGSPARIGIGYNAGLVQFVNSIWSVKRASAHAESLQRSLRRLNEINLL